MTLEFHELAELFPAMTGEPFEELTESIATHGLLEPITLLDGKILDGRNRYRACIASGAEVRTANYSGADPESFVFAKNLNRRQLTQKQKREIIRSFIKRHPRWADHRIARTLGVANDTVANVRSEHFPETQRDQRETADGKLIPAQYRTAAELEAARQQAVALKAEGKTNREIAEVLGYSAKTGAVHSLLKRPPLALTPENESRTEGDAGILEPRPHLEVVRDPELTPESKPPGSRKTYNEIFRGNVMTITVAIKNTAEGVTPEMVEQISTTVEEQERWIAALEEAGATLRRYTKALRGHIRKAQSA